MNKNRKKQIEGCRWKLDEIRNELDCLKDEEQEYYDNMPDSIQQGEKGQKVEECISMLEEAISDIQIAMDNIDEAIEQ